MSCKPSYNNFLPFFQSESGGAFKGFKGFVLPSGSGGFSGFGNGTGTKPLGGLSNGGGSSSSITNTTSFTNLKTAAETQATSSKFTCKFGIGRSGLNGV